MLSFIDDPQAVDADWLTTVLQQGGHLNRGKVKDLRKTALGGSVGFLSRVVRLTCEYEGSCSTLPNSFILKAHTVIPNFLELAEELKAFDRELGFYQRFHQKVKSRLPHFYGGYSDGGRGWLLIEDLGSAEPCDQVVGLSNSQVVKTLENIAAVHALCWQSKELELIDWLPTNDFWFSCKSGLEDSWNTLKQSYGLRIGPEACQLIDKFTKHYKELFEQLKSKPKTLIHGDLRADNLMLSKGADRSDEVIILDWQTATQSLGAIDVAFLIAGSEPAAERHGHVHSLVCAWHSKLLDNGITDYSFEEAYEDVRFALLLCLAVPIKAFEELGGPNFKNAREAQLAELMIFRYSQAALDLNISDLLDA